MVNTMLFWIFLALALFSLLFMIWGLVASKKIAIIETSSEKLADDLQVLEDSSTIDLDPTDGRIGASRKFRYGKEAKASGNIKYSTSAIAHGWKTGDAKLRFSIAAIIIGLVGIFAFLALAFLSKGGNNFYIGISILVFGIVGLRPFIFGLIKASKE